MALTAPVLKVGISHRAVMRWARVTDAAYYEAWDGTKFLKKLQATTVTYTTPELSPGEHKIRVVAYDAASKPLNSNVETVMIYSGAK